MIGLLYIGFLKLSNKLMKNNFLKNIKIKRPFSYLFIIILCLPLLFINLRSCHDWGDDFAQYIHQAQNIVQGIAQSNTGYIYSSDNPVLGPPAYLVGFPLILAPVYCFFGNSIPAFLTLINICLILLAVFVFRFYSKHFSVITSFLLVLIFAYNPWLLSFKAEIMSEIPFTLLLFVILEIYNKIRDCKSIIWQLILGLLIGFLMSIRPTGAVFILAIAIVILKTFIDNIKNGQKNVAWHMAFHNSISIFTALLFFFFLNKILFHIPSGAVSSYANIFKLKSLIAIITNNIAYYFDCLKLFFSTDNYYLKFFAIFTQSAFLVFAVIGWIKKTLIRPAFVELLVAMFALVILMYPYTGAGLRFLLPVFPFLLYYASLTARDLLMPMNLKYKNAVIVFIGICVLFQYKDSVLSIIRNSDNIVWGPQHEQATAAFSYIKNKLPENAVIEFEKPRALSLYTGRNGFHVNNTLSVDAITLNLEKAGVSYILDINEPIEIYTENNLKLYIFRNANHLKTIWSNNKFSLYKLDNQLNQSFEEFNGLVQKEPLFQSVMTYDTITNTEVWQNINATSEISFSGKNSGRLTKDIAYGLTYKTNKLPVITQKSTLLFFKSYFFHDMINDCDIVVSINENGKSTYYKSYNLSKLLISKNKWEKVELLFNLPKVNATDYEFAIYLWNKGGNNLNVDDFEFRIY